jgi:hypothetical protein
MLQLLLLLLLLQVLMIMVLLKMMTESLVRLRLDVVLSELLLWT